MNRNRVRTGRRLLLFALVIAGCCGASQAQTQMLLPFTEPIFQSTWANPAAQPLHRFSVGLPVLSSVEAGVVHNGFTIASVGTLRGRRWYIDGEKLEKAVANQSNMLYGEAQVDLLHYRMAWRNWFFWFGARTVADTTVFYPSDLVNAAVHGNNAYLGKELDMTGLDVISKAYSEFTLGASTFFGDWGVGARVSLLNGIFCGEAKPGKLAIEVGDDKADMYKHTVHVKGTVRTAGVPYRSNGRPDFSDLKNNIPSRILNLGNPGVALSAGVSYRPERHTKITFSFSDLGFIHWGNKLGALAPKSADYTLARCSIRRGSFGVGYRMSSRRTSSSTPRPARTQSHSTHGFHPSSTSLGPTPSQSKPHWGFHLMLSSIGRISTRALRLACSRALATFFWGSWPLVTTSAPSSIWVPDWSFARALFNSTWLPTISWALSSLAG